MTNEFYCDNCGRVIFMGDMTTAISQGVAGKRILERCLTLCPECGKKLMIHIEEGKLEEP